MAKPIKETPTLYGKDAERFLKSIENPKKISKEQKEIMLKNYNELKNILTK